MVLKKPILPACNPAPSHPQTRAHAHPYQAMQSITPKCLHCFTSCASIVSASLQKGPHTHLHCFTSCISVVTTSTGMGGRNLDTSAGARPLVVIHRMALALESMAVCWQPRMNNNKECLIKHRGSCAWGPQVLYTQNPCTQGQHRPASIVNKTAKMSHHTKKALCWKALSTHLHSPAANGLYTHHWLRTKIE